MRVAFLMVMIQDVMTIGVVMFLAYWFGWGLVFVSAEVSKKMQ